MDKQLLANPQAEFVCMLVERLEKLERKLDASEETDVIWSCFEQAQQQADHALKVRIQEAIKPVLVSHPSHFICVFPSLLTDNVIDWLYETGFQVYGLVRYPKTYAQQGLIAWGDGHKGMQYALNHLLSTISLKERDDRKVLQRDNLSPTATHSHNMLMK